LRPTALRALSGPADPIFTQTIKSGGRTGRGP
jgi:hypothetical protein